MKYISLKMCLIYKTGSKLDFSSLQLSKQVNIYTNIFIVFKCYFSLWQMYTIFFFYQERYGYAVWLLFMKRFHGRRFLPLPFHSSLLTNSSTQSYNISHTDSQQCPMNLITELWGKYILFGYII